MTESLTPTEAMPHASVPRALLLVFAPFSAGYFLSYVFRTVNAVIAAPLIEDLGLSAADLGLLTAAYFLAFAAFQIPLGLLLDRFGPRRVQSALLLVAALGALLFALGKSKEALLLARALIGLGVAGGLMASIKAITLWFPKDRWPLVKGCFLAMGGLGAMAATAPVEAALQLTDWRGLFLALSVATCLAAALTFSAVPEKRKGLAQVELRVALRGLKRIYGDRFFWRLAPIGMFCSGASMSIQGLWAGPWLADVAGFERDRVATGLLSIAAAMTIGSVTAGVVADLLGRLGIALRRVLIGGILLFLLAQTAIVFEVQAEALWPWVAFGLSSSFTILAMPMISGHFPLELAGRANTAFNVLVFSMAFATQFAIGAIIDLWPTRLDGGYDAEAYRVAFGAILALELVAFVWLILPLGRKDR